MATSLNDQLICLQQEARHSNTRRVVVLSGDFEASCSVAETFIREAGTTQALTVSDQLPHALSARKARTQLGNEYDVIIFDAYHALDVDALGAVSGTLRGGGLLFIIVPSLSQWPSLTSSRFHQRLLPLLKSFHGVYRVEQNRMLPSDNVWRGEVSKPDEYATPYLSSDQQRVVEGIYQHVVQQPAAPLVLTSDRGRGKSAALGLVAAQLLRRGMKHIIVTAPRMATCDTLFRHASAQLAGARQEKGRLFFNGGELRFMAADALLEERPEAQLLMVDEAAAMPLPMIEAILAQYPGTVFASTIHGYEGSGRGFLIKFKTLLQRTAPAHQWLSMTIPVRWATGDPVEHWVDRVLCLDAELDEVDVTESVVPSACLFQELDRDQLLKDEQQLSALFALLVEAHYRTQPSDLQYLLDEPAVRIYGLKYRHKLVAALLVNEEGGFSEDMSTQIYRGERRPAGHLLAQTLSFHAGCEQAARLRYARVMRIAVHPLLQGRGLGSSLLAQVMKQEQSRGLDAIGSSFGATPALMRFWQHAGFDMVRMGFTRDHASGTYSAVMLYPYSEAGNDVCEEVMTRFARSLRYWLAGPLSDLPQSMHACLEPLAEAEGSPLSEMDWQDIRSFAYSHRGYEACMAALNRLLGSIQAHLTILPEQQACLLQSRVQQGKSWAQTVKACDLTGKAEAIRQLREGIKKILEESEINLNFSS